MRTRVIVAVLAVAAVAVGGWYFFLRSDNPEQVSLEGAVEAVTGSTAPTETQPQAEPDPTAPSPEETTTETPADPGLDGTWTLVADGSSFVGYRVGEELAGIGVTEAVGRTMSVTGSLELEGSTVTAVEVEADLTGLRSDDDRRDGAMRRQALETGTFPTATFSLAEPIELGSIPGEGDQITVTAVGDLTLHGVTRSIEIPLEGQLVEGSIVVVGAVDLVYGDFDISLPSAPILVGVDDHGLLELQLVFGR
jgi:polyisoprenoid-binding protein YceI